MKPWRPADPARAAERSHDSESLTASVGRLLESLAECRRERDAARREADVQRRRADAFLRHTERLRALLDRRHQPRLRAADPGQLPLNLTSRTAP
ncbi:hypothetical protein [Plasticicumulans sp.]|uniref:hypothetical protein n=1 Tax=Plasticicumulans sp. TaxID=2307179 RepID=UPI0039300065|nr:hypothetical protein [Pseudomonadota bacterium]